MSHPVAQELQAINAHLAKMAQSLEWFDELLRERKQREAQVFPVVRLEDAQRSVVPPPDK